MHCTRPIMASKVPKFCPRCRCNIFPSKAGYCVVCGTKARKLTPNQLRRFETCRENDRKNSDERRISLPSLREVPVPKPFHFQPREYDQE